jgi:predicted anti-sigma-YlaC factor YlaD
MPCCEQTERMSLYLDGQLATEEIHNLQTHIDECEDCRQVWESMCTISAQFGAEPMAVPSPGFTLRVNQRIQKREAYLRRLHSSIRLVAGSLLLWSVVALSITILTLLLWQPSFRILLFGGALPLLKSILATLIVLGRALASVAHALAERVINPTALVSALLALALAIVWSRVVFQHWAGVPNSL